MTTFTVGGVYLFEGTARGYIDMLYCVLRADPLDHEELGRVSYVDLESGRAGFFYFYSSCFKWSRRIA